MDVASIQIHLNSINYLYKSGCQNHRKANVDNRWNICRCIVCLRIHKRLQLRAIAAGATAAAAERDVRHLFDHVTCQRAIATAARAGAVIGPPLPCRWWDELPLVRPYVPSVDRLWDLFIANLNDGCQHILDNLKDFLTDDFLGSRSLRVLPFPRSFHASVHPFISIRQDVRYRTSVFVQIIINHRLLNPEFKRERTDVTYTSDNYVGCINSFTRKDAHKINMYSRSVFISQYMNVSTVLRCSYYFSGCRRINQIICIRSLCVGPFRARRSLWGCMERSISAVGIDFKLIDCWSKYFKRKTVFREWQRTLNGINEDKDDLDRRLKSTCKQR